MNNKEIVSLELYLRGIFNPVEGKVKGLESLCIEQSRILRTLKKTIMKSGRDREKIAQQMAEKKMGMLLRAMESEKKAVHKTIADLSKTYDLLFRDIETLCDRPGRGEKDRVSLHVKEELGLLQAFFSDFASLIIRFEECCKTMGLILNESYKSPEGDSEKKEVHECQLQLTSNV